MNKKFICTFLAAIISISLLGCGKGKDNPESSKEKSAASESSTANTKETNKTSKDTAAQDGSKGNSTAKSSAASNNAAKNQTAATTTNKSTNDSKKTTAAAKPKAASPSKTATNDPIMALGKLEFSLKDIEGDTYNSKDVFKENKLTLMNIWGTLCTPCIKELPELQKLSAELSSKGIGIIGLVGDVNGDDGLDETKTIVKKKAAEMFI